MQDSDLSDSAILTRRRTRRTSGVLNATQPISLSSPQIDVQTLQDHFHLPITEVAKKLGVCATVLKKICRKNGISRWPHRKIKSIDKAIAQLEAMKSRSTGTQLLKVLEELDARRVEKEALVKNPNGNNSSRSIKSRRHAASHRTSYRAYDVGSKYVSSDPEDDDGDDDDDSESSVGATDGFSDARSSSTTVSTPSFHHQHLRHQVMASAVASASLPGTTGGLRSRSASVSGSATARVHTGPSRSHSISSVPSPTMSDRGIVRGPRVATLSSLSNAEASASAARMQQHMQLQMQQQQQQQQQQQMQQMQLQQQMQSMNMPLTVPQFAHAAGPPYPLLCSPYVPTSGQNGGPTQAATPGMMAPPYGWTPQSSLPSYSLDPGALRFWAPLPQSQLAVNPWSWQAQTLTPAPGSYPRPVAQSPHSAPPNSSASSSMSNSTTPLPNNTAARGFASNGPPSTSNVVVNTLTPPTATPAAPTALPLAVQPVAPQPVPPAAQPDGSSTVPLAEPPRAHSSESSNPTQVNSTSPTSTNPSTDAASPLSTNETEKLGQSSCISPSLASSAPSVLKSASSSTSATISEGDITVFTKNTSTGREISVKILDSQDGHPSLMDLALTASDDSFDGDSKSKSNSSIKSTDGGEAHVIARAEAYAGGE